jgi:class 3 adenylate cyclase
MDLGDFAAADTYLTHDLALVAQHEPANARVQSQLCSHLGECKLRLGDVGGAEQHFLASYRLGDQPVSIAFALLGLGRVALVRAATQAAMDVARFVLAAMACLDVPAKPRASIEALAHALAGDARQLAGAFDGAIADYNLAIAALAAADASPIVRAEVLRGLSRAQRARHDTPHAVSNLRLALTALDATTARGMRRDIETELEHASNLAWIAHSAGRFIGRAQLEDVLRKAGDDGYQGELRRLTILFSDIRGFTSVSEQLAPSELVLLLNDFLTAMTRCIEHHGGEVDKFIGDAVMAVFPRDPSVPSDPIGAALAMREELTRMNRVTRKYNSKLGGLSIGIGIHSGNVVSGLIGSPQKRSVTVIGDAVNAASRLEGMTKQLGASILVTDAVLDGVDRDRYLLRPLGSFSPKGKRDAIAVYDVMGLRDKSPASHAIRVEIRRVEAALRALSHRELAYAEAELNALATELAAQPRAVGYRLLADNAATWTGAIALHDK